MACLRRAASSIASVPVPNKSRVPGSGESPEALPRTSKAWRVVVPMLDHGPPFWDIRARPVAPTLLSNHSLELSSAMLCGLIIMKYVAPPVRFTPVTAVVTRLLQQVVAVVLTRFQTALGTIAPGALLTSVQIEASKV